MVLIKFQACWADEFDCEQFVIVNSLQAAEKYVAELLEDSISFGTNEGWEPGEVSKRNFEFFILYDKDVETFERIFGENCFGDIRFGTGPL